MAGGRAVRTRDICGPASAIQLRAEIVVQSDLSQICAQRAYRDTAVVQHLFDAVHLGVVQVTDPHAPGTTQFGEPDTSLIEKFELRCEVICYFIGEAADGPQR